MPSRAPPLESQSAAQLIAIGQRLRAHRKQLHVSATTAAEAANMSRVTLHRIERGEPSVTMGAYLSAIAALGLMLDIAGPPASSPGTPGSPSQRVGPVAALPASVPLADYPQLQRLAWHLPGVTEVTAAQALALYESNWRHLDAASLLPHEQALVQTLARELGGGRLLV